MATTSVGCHQTLPLPHTPALAGVSPAPPAPTAATVRLDSTARRLRLALLLLTRPLAAAARAFIDRRGWQEFGYARLSDHAHERLGRSARWVRDLAALDEAAGRLPALAAALTGEDGGRPIGLVAARCIGQVASQDSLPVWISIARTHTARELKALVRRAVTAGSSWPVAADETSGQETPSDDESRQRVRLLVPAPAREAFTEVLELYRAVEGHAAPVGEFVEDLLAEVASGPLAGRVPQPGRDTTGTPAGFEPAAAHESDDSVRVHVRTWLHEILCTPSPPAGTAGATPAGEADTRMRRLMALHDALERRLAETVTAMAETCAWRVTGCLTLHAYTRQVLGWSRSTTYDRMQLVRLLGRLPVVRQAYRQGRIGTMAARTIAGLLTQESPDGTIPLTSTEATQRAWVERAAAATVKRLQDETRAVSRLMVLGATRREPLTDQAWHGSLRRHAGTTRARVEALTRMALSTPAPLLPLSLSLPAGTADRLVQALDVARRDPALIRTFSAGRSDRQEGSVTSVPAWAALLALLQEFTATWDVDQAGRRSSAQRIPGRDGWRCMAPGCTSRRNLEVHHVVYRSQGGNDRPENLVTLCRFHHQMGEHGLLAKVRGTAPLHLTWTLGRNGKGGIFRNDLREIRV